MMDGSRLEDAISIAPYIRNVVADVRGMGGGADVYVYVCAWMYTCV